MASNPLPACELKKINHQAAISKRVQRDVMDAISEPPPGIVVTVDDSDFTLLHALIIGPENTPYEGGFFYFVVRLTKEYPFKPPTVTFMTTGGSRVRFNPNLYQNGKVCLSILGTWPGPCWSAGMTLTSVFISIQSLLNEKPYHNEPGFETMERYRGDAEKYNDIIQHETLRVAVVGMLDNDFGLTIPARIREAMESSFLQFYDKYEAVARNKSDLTGILMKDPFGNCKRDCFQYKTILQRLKFLHHRLSQDN